MLLLIWLFALALGKEREPGSFALQHCHRTSLLQGPPPRNVSGYERVVVVGDVHGDYERLLEILDRVNITMTMGEERCRFIASRVLLVQMGDVVDRGPRSLESWQCLGKLQATAHARGSSVVRMLGNHELMWLEGETVYRNPVTDTPAVVDQLTKLVRADVLAGRVQAALSHVSFKGVELFFSHAGLRPQMLNMLMSRIRAAEGLDASAVRPLHIAEFLNNKLVADIQACASSTVRCRLQDAIYSAGKERGGIGVGGPFWTDWSILEQMAQVGNPPFAWTQVVGHTPIVSKIRFAKGLSAICVDVGIYLGGAGWLEHHESGHFVSTVYSPKGSSRLRRQDITNEMCSKII